MKNNQAIGVFDSGIGGLIITEQIKKIMPNESIIYFGDYKHLPYGDKSKKSIIKYVINITKFLLKKKCKAIIIACNTASANALKEIQNITKNKALVIDVITPVVEKISYQYYKKIAVIGTNSTINSQIYTKSILKINPKIKIIELATPLFVPIIEKGLYNDPILLKIINNYLSNFKLDKINSIILGCTHYHIINRQIKKFFNYSVNVINTPKILANFLFNKLKNHNLLSNQSNPNDSFYLSKNHKYIQKNAKIIFGNLIKVKIINLENI